MNAQERQHIEYRPKLSYSRDLSYVVRKFSLPPETVSSYEMPPELADATSLSATAVLADALNVRDRASTLVSDLVKGATDLPGPVSLADYLKARAEGNVAIIAAFEDFHANDLAGTTQGEVVPLLLELVDEMEALAGELSATFFPEGIKEDALEEAMTQEKEMLDALIAEDMASRAAADQAQTSSRVAQKTANSLARPSAADKRSLSVRAQLLHASADQVQSASEVVDKIEAVLKQTANDKFKGGIRSTISSLSSAPEAARAGVAKLSELRFMQAAARGRAVMAQKRAFNGPAVRRKLWELIRELMRQWQEVCVPTLEWLNTLPYKYTPNDPLTLMATDMVKAIEQVRNELNDALLDLLKQTVLDADHRAMLLEAIGEKKGDRQMVSLINSMDEQFDFDDPDAERQIRRLVENNGLEKSGTIHTR